MALFKKKMSKEDIIAAIYALSDEEQAELFEQLADELEEQEDEPIKTADEPMEDEDNAEATGEPQYEKQINKSEEGIAEKDAGIQTEKDRFDKSESESERVEFEDKEEVYSALGARIDALEEQLYSLTERLEQMLSNLENKDFGARHGGGAEKSATEDDEAYMDAYYKKQPRRN